MTAAGKGAALDRMEDVGTCIAAVCDLMNPDPDLQETQRSNIAVLLGFLQGEYQAANEALRKAC